jgi:hypothetical protein
MSAPGTESQAENQEMSSYRLIIVQQGSWWSSFVLLETLPLLLLPSLSSKVVAYFCLPWDGRALFHH